MILAYSVALPGDIRLPGSLQLLLRDNFQCFYAEHHRPIDPQNLKDEALRFYEINRQLFAQTGILEFRFPTILKDAYELAGHIAQMEATLAEDLRRLSGLAQLTIYLPSEQTPSTAAPTGTEYLKAKSDATKRHQSVVGDLSALPGVRDTRADGDRVHLLVPRAEAGRVKSDLVVRHVSAAGPFPPSSFARLLS